MTKAAFLFLGLAALAVIPSAVRAQDNAAENSAISAADNEAVMRQANTIVLRQKLTDARAADQRGDVASAAKLYQESCALAQKVGSGIDVETLDAVSGLTRTRLALARDAQGRGDYHEADLQVQQILHAESDLKVSPDADHVINFKKHNDELLVMNQGRSPDVETLDKVPQMQKARIDASTMVQNGKVYYEMGQLDAAETNLTAAIQIDPGNSTATYYLNLISQAKIQRDMAWHNTDTQDRMERVERQWIPPHSSASLPVPNPYATNDLTYTGPGRQGIVTKLDKFRLDTFSTGDSGMPLSEVLNQLSEKCRLHDPERKGINFLINNNPDLSGNPGPGIRVGTTGPGGGAGGAPGGVGGFGGGVGRPAGVAAAGPQLDPTTGLPIQPSAEAGAGGGEAQDIGSTIIKIPSLTDVRLADLLDAIVLVADHPIKYSIQDFAIVFSPKNPEGEPLFMRTFRVDPNTFYSGLESVGSVAFASSFENNTSGGGSSGGGGGGGGGGSGQQQSAVVGVVNVFSGAGQARTSAGGGAGATATGGANAGAAQNQVAIDAFDSGEGLLAVTKKAHNATFSYLAAQFFATLGIDWTTPPGKAVFFNDRLGYLFVKSTESDLDTIEKAIQVLNQVPPQVHIKTRFIEVQQNDSSALGFNWYLGQFQLGNQAVGQGGTAPSLTVPTSAANPLGAFPGNSAANLIAPAATDQLLTSGLRDSAPTLATFTGILTDPNFRVTLQALSQRTGVETLGEPEITTISGRQTQMRATEIINVVTGFGINNGTEGNQISGTPTSSSGLNTVLQPPPTAVIPVTQPIETGPVLDVVPYVLADGYTINLALIPSDTEFVGYQQIPANAIPGYTPGTTVGNANAFTVPVALPSFTVRQLVTTVNVWDNQTVVLGGLITSTVNNQKDEVPIIGDVPLIGRLFQSQSKTTEKNNLMIFVTSTIVDPAGSRTHSDEELPFAQSGFPVQPSDNIAPAVTEKVITGAPMQNP